MYEPDFTKGRFETVTLYRARYSPDRPPGTDSAVFSKREDAERFSLRGRSPDVIREFPAVRLYGSKEGLELPVPRVFAISQNRLHVDELLRIRRNERKRELMALLSDEDKEILGIAL